MIDKTVAERKPRKTFLIQDSRITGVLAFRPKTIGSEAETDGCNYKDRAEARIGTYYSDGCGELLVYANRRKTKYLQVLIEVGNCCRPRNSVSFRKPLECGNWMKRTAQYGEWSPAEIALRDPSSVCCFDRESEVKSQYCDRPLETDIEHLGVSCLIDIKVKLDELVAAFECPALV